jgi:hypothetical protein
VNGYLAGLLAIMSGIAIAIVGELLSDEVRARLDQVPRGILRLAARWLDPGQRATVYRDEWEPELVYILKGAEARPVTRLITGTRYALGILINTRRIARHLHRPAPEQPDLAAADGAKHTGTIPGQLATLLATLRGLPAVVAAGRTVEVSIDGDVLRLTHASLEQQKAIINLFLARSTSASTDLDALVDAAVALARVDLGRAEHLVRAIADASQRALAQIASELAEKDPAEAERIARTANHPGHQPKELARTTATPVVRMPPEAN